MAGALGMSGMEQQQDDGQHASNLLFDFASKQAISGMAAGAMMPGNETMMLANEQTTQDYLDGLLASIGVQQQAGQSAEQQHQQAFFSN